MEANQNYDQFHPIVKDILSLHYQQEYRKQISQCYQEALGLFDNLEALKEYCDKYYFIKWYYEKPWKLAGVTETNLDGDGKLSASIQFYDIGKYYFNKELLQ